MQNLISYTKLMHTADSMVSVGARKNTHTQERMVYVKFIYFEFTFLNES